MSTYPEDHPLYDKSAEWISEAAERRSEFLSKSFETFRMPESVALAHEYKRLKATEDLAASQWHQLVHDIGSELPHSLGTPIHCKRRGLVAQTKELLKRCESAESLAAEMKAKSTAAHAKIFMLETTSNLTISKTATPTQTELSRIAAALEVIANAH